MEILKFTVDSALLGELGERLVESVHVALVELVKNAYDADATEVIVKFTEGTDGNLELHITDDGVGMNFSQVKSYWMHIATTNKAKHDVSPLYGRPRTGSKGIGRFSCRRLGRHLKLITVAHSNEESQEFQKTEIMFEWDKFIPGTDVTEIQCPGSVELFNEAETGTTLVISDLIDEWSARGYNYLKRQLAVLSANRGTKRKGYKHDPGFNILIDASDFEGGIRDLREDFINAGWGTLKAYINNKKQAVCELEALGIGKKILVSERIFENLKDVKLQIGILVGKRDQMRNTDALSIGTLNKILPEWGGVQVRYRGFRAYPYGDDDWLDIDHDRGLRKGKTQENELNAFAHTLRGIDPRRSLLNLLSMRSYVGNVEIGYESVGFEMKANREGFIESASVRELKDFVRFAIDWSTIYREFYLKTLIQNETDAARDHLEKAVNEKIEADKLVACAVNYLKNEIKTVGSLLPGKEKKELEKAFSSATDAILTHDKSNQEELSHLRLIASTSTLLLIFTHEVKSLLGLIENSRSALTQLEDKLPVEDRKLVKNIYTEFTDIKSRFNELLGMTSLIGVDSKKEKPKKLALTERLERAKSAYQLILNSYNIELDYSEVPTNIVVGPILEAELFAILLNVFSNSIKSVIAAGKKKIKVTARRENGKTIINIKDTGVGLDPTLYDDVFIPFVADIDGQMYHNLESKLNPEDKYIVGTGSGLGLSIVKEIVQARKGAISFCEPSGEWKADLEVILP